LKISPSISSGSLQGANTSADKKDPDPPKSGEIPPLFLLEGFTEELFKAYCEKTFFT
jgi:hypothetical protein